MPVDDARAIGLLHALRDKELEDDPGARKNAREHLTEMSKFIIGMIEAMGRKGDINDTDQVNVFVQNWRNFTLESQYRGEDLWRGLLYFAANGNEELEIPPLLCDHIRNSEAFKSLLPREVDDLIQSGIKRRVNSLEEYLVASKCDSLVNDNFEIFINDFNAGGGWEMFKRLSQPQNNIFGAIGLAMDELERQRKVEEQSDIQEANSGSGYLGRRECLALGPSGQCVIWGNVILPADLAVETLGALINQNLAFIANTDEAGEDQEAFQLDIITDVLVPIFGFDVREF